MSTEKPLPQLTAVTLATVGCRPKAQLKAWRRTTEPHEQVALGRKVSSSKITTEKWLEEIEHKIEVNGAKQMTGDVDERLG